MFPLISSWTWTVSTVLVLLLMRLFLLLNANNWQECENKATVWRAQHSLPLCKKSDRDLISKNHQEFNFSAAAILLDSVGWKARRRVLWINLSNGESFIKIAIGHYWPQSGSRLHPRQLQRAGHCQPTFFWNKYLQLDYLKRQCNLQLKIQFEMSRNYSIKCIS